MFYVLFMRYFGVNFWFYLNFIHKEQGPQLMLGSLAVAESGLLACYTPGMLWTFQSNQVTVHLFVFCRESRGCNLPFSIGTRALKQEYCAPWAGVSPFLGRVRDPFSSCGTAWCEAPMQCENLLTRPCRTIIIIH